MPDFSYEGEFPDRDLGAEWLRQQRRQRILGDAVLRPPTEQIYSPGTVQVSRHFVVEEGVGLGNETYRRTAVPVLTGEVVIGR